jgi:hypothetical protein
MLVSAISTLKKLKRGKILFWGKLQIFSKFGIKHGPRKLLYDLAPPRVDHLDVVGRLTPSMNGNQEFTTPRSLMSQAGPSHWDVCP